MIDTLSGSKAALRVGFEARRQQVPLRELDPLVSLPGTFNPPASMVAPPWGLTAELLQQQRPSSRDLGAAWLLLSEPVSPAAGAASSHGAPPAAMPLEELVALVAPADTPAARAACWLVLQHQEQHFFRWRHGAVQPRTLRDLRQLRRERHLERLSRLREQRWQALLQQRQPLDPSSLDAQARAQLDHLLALAGGDTTTPLPVALRQALHGAHCSAEPGAVRRLLVDLGQWEPHALPSLQRTVWEQGFVPDLLAEAERLIAAAADPQPGDDQRRDLTTLRTYTLDDPDTLEIDDALSLEQLGDGRQRLWVHIADPGRLVPPESPLDLEARRRASSLYLADRVVPMFPFPLATGPFSLRQGHRCAAWSTAIELDDEGAVADVEIVRSWVLPTYRLSYADGDALIELAPKEEPDLASIDALLERRRRWRVAQGALQMEQPEGRIRAVDGQTSVEITDPSPARALVAEAMILNGAVIAAYGVSEGLALPYRGQPSAELPPAAQLEALPPGPVRHMALRRCLTRGVTGVQPCHHFSLGLSAYVQATSPIRRYADLVVQRQLAAHQQHQPPLDGTDLGALLDQLDPPLREGVQISREDQRHWQQVWFEQHPQERLEGVFLRWLREQDRLGLVHLEALALDVAARCPAAAEPGTTLTVHVQMVDSLSDLLRLEAR
ncbi:MAG: ribonuclease II [Cyanobium sp.]|nr:MAG: ribonuclease II [Cyanobium sp.]